MNITINITIGTDGKISVSSTGIPEEKKPESEKTESPFRFIPPDYFETWDRGNSAHLPNNPYKILRYVCDSAGLCADIAEMCQSLKIEEEAVEAAMRMAIAPRLKARGFQWRISRRNGYIFLRKTTDGSEREPESEAPPKLKVNQPIYGECLPVKDWEFNDDGNQLIIGDSVFTFGNGSYDLLKYVMSGGVDLAECWKKAWGYNSKPEYDTIRSRANTLNAKFKNWNIPYRIHNTTKEIHFTEYREGGEN